jgi:hypothetical protein
MSTAQHSTALHCAHVDQVESEVKAREGSLVQEVQLYSAKAPPFLFVTGRQDASTLCRVVLGTSFLGGAWYLGVAVGG